MNNLSRLQKEFSVSEEVASRAWDACCDPECIVQAFGELDYDPWDGDHEEKRKEIEAYSIEEAKEIVKEIEEEK
jgi:phosphopantothenoylcysteine synthetase/decarboxylase